MNIFFATSLYGKDKFEEYHQKIVDMATSLGHTIHSDHILKLTEEEVAHWDEEAEVKHYKKVVDGIKKSDVFFAEVSYASTSVGYLIALAVQASKPVVIFYSGSEEPHIFKSLEKTNDKVQVIRFSSTTDLEQEVPYALDFAHNTQDTRFNFFISPDQSHYLDWIARHKKIPRSVYLRQLIDNHMTQNEI